MTQKQFLQNQLNENLELIAQNDRYGQEFKDELKEENEILKSQIAAL